jgi:hypothetical protein
MIYDCFSFNHELDVLDIRLHELDSVVDRFVLCEAGITHTGRPKPLFFEQSKERFAAFLPKIIHVKLESLPNGTSRAKEAAQREALLGPLRDELHDDDLLLFCDVDEIPRAEAVLRAKEACDRERLPFVLQMPLYYYHLNGFLAPHWFGTAVLRWDTLQTYRQGSVQIARKRRKRGRVLGRSEGWHFSTVGSPEDVLYKFQAIPDDEEQAKHLDLQTIQKTIAERTCSCHLGNTWYGEKTTPVRLDETFPRWLIENKERFKSLLLEIEE